MAFPLRGCVVEQRFECGAACDLLRVRFELCGRTAALFPSGGFRDRQSVP
jgi:hypothetical protein